MMMGLLEHMRGLWRSINIDIERSVYYASDFQSEKINWKRRVSVFLTPNLLCCFFFRLACAFHRVNMFRTAMLLSRLNLLINGCQISPESRIGDGLYIPHPKQIIFNGIAGNNLTLYANCVVARDTLTGESQYATGFSPLPEIGNDVLIGAEAVLLGGVTIGDNAVIGANTVVRSDVPSTGLAITPSQSTYRLHHAEGAS